MKARHQLPYDEFSDRALAKYWRMVKLYYRGMAEENGRPKMGRNPRLLGVRPSIDIDIEQMPRDWLDERGYLKPEAERASLGESVTVAIRRSAIAIKD
ncbi:hypothetical protein [Scytonema sp. NUACC26]|uniref:hypothetical protein n=1 Tax=Scytonema sp. NUACC26 TaxID=3140176 RepID=UPI0034DBB316